LQAWGESQQVEVEAAHECAWVGARGWLDAGIEDLLEEELVDGQIHGELSGEVGQGRFYGGGPGPVVLPFRAFGDPAFEQGLLLFIEVFLGVRRGHLLIGVGVEDAAVQFALAGLSGDEGRRDAFGEQAFVRVEPELGLALLFIGAVAGVALVGKDGPDVAVELDGFGLGAEVCGQDQSAEEVEGSIHLCFPS